MGFQIERPTQLSLAERVEKISDKNAKEKGSIGRIGTGERGHLTTEDDGRIGGKKPSENSTKQGPVAPGRRLC